MLWRRGVFQTKKMNIYSTSTVTLSSSFELEIRIKYSFFIKSFLDVKTNIFVVHETQTSSNSFIICYVFEELDMNRICDPILFDWIQVSRSNAI